MATSFKVFNKREKVRDSKQEMAEYLRHADRLRQKLSTGKLYIDIKNMRTIPSFMTEFPKNDQDGSYFVVSCWAEVVE